MSSSHSRFWGVGRIDKLGVIREEGALRNVPYGEWRNGEHAKNVVPVMPASGVNHARGRSPQSFLPCMLRISFSGNGDVVFRTQRHHLREKTIPVFHGFLRGHPPKQPSRHRFQGGTVVFVQQRSSRGIHRFQHTGRGLFVKSADHCPGKDEREHFNGIPPRFTLRPKPFFAQGSTMPAEGQP